MRPHGMETVLLASSVLASSTGCSFALRGSTDLGGLDIVLGGTAYLLHHFQTDDCSKALELVLEDGTRCGFLDVRGPSKCSPRHADRRTRRHDHRPRPRELHDVRLERRCGPGAGPLSS